MDHHKSPDREHVSNYSQSFESFPSDASVLQVVTLFETQTFKDTGKSPTIDFIKFIASYEINYKKYS